MEDYIFSTIESLPTNNDVMSEFLENENHFYSIFDKDSEIVIIDGTYAEVINSDGCRYAVHAGGNGDFFNHRIRFELL
ncbi:hypothetical protein AB9J70_06305 [Elizabethkingia anophelis]|uniref:hypothetical protein n=1 Tax=Elizabethkingia anophelis TaxID=1117645 RepID=UPI0035570AE8